MMEEIRIIVDTDTRNTIVAMLSDYQVRRIPGEERKMNFSEFAGKVFTAAVRSEIACKAVPSSL